MALVLDLSQQAKIKEILDRLNPPKAKESKFLDQVQSAIDRRRIFRNRVVAMVAGPVAIATSPVIGLELFRWWRWVGVDYTLCGVAGTVVGLAIMAVGATFTTGALSRSLLQKLVTMLMEHVQVGDIVKIRKPEEFGSVDFFDTDSIQCAFLVKSKGAVACQLTAIDGHGPPRWQGRECEVNPFWLERDEFLTQAWKANKEHK